MTRRRIKVVPATFLFLLALCFVLALSLPSPYWPPSWPGFLIIGAVLATGRGSDLPSTAVIVIAAAINFTIYGAFLSRVIAAEIRSNGRISRMFLKASG